VIAAVALGAFAAASAGQVLQSQQQTSDDSLPLAGDARATLGMGGGGSVAPDVLAVVRTSDASAEAQKMVASEQIYQAKAAEAAKQARIAEEANRPKFFRPAEGTLTSAYGARWGTTHYGIDIANRIGTPILAVADGRVVEAGPASGFGLWVCIEHADGTTTVYGHVDTYSVRVGQQVKAGQQIARMGNRGQSTGPHLHFEVWNAGGMKINPLPWLATRGIRF
jgi:murein DD-endopeptidase MepM/ murein hydrolase activator NlpD